MVFYDQISLVVFAMNVTELTVCKYKTSFFIKIWTFNNKSFILFGMFVNKRIQREEKYLKYCQ